MGIGNIMAAKCVVLVATGESKAKAVYDTIRGPITPRVPASVLQLHPCCVILTDREAGKLMLESKPCWSKTERRSSAATLRRRCRVENGKIAQIGDLQPREGEEIRSAAGLCCCRGLWISTSTLTRARTACAGKRRAPHERRSAQNRRGGVHAHDDERAD